MNNFLKAFTIGIFCLSALQGHEKKTALQIFSIQYYENTNTSKNICRKFFEISHDNCAKKELHSKQISLIFSKMNRRVTSEHLNNFYL